MNHLLFEEELRLPEAEKFQRALSEMLRVMDLELSAYEHGAAYHWIDKNFDNAWSKLVDRFDLALARFRDDRDYEKMQKSVNYYRDFMVKHLRLYREAHHIDATNEFLKALKK